MVCFSPEIRSVSRSKAVGDRLTVKKGCREVDTQITIPAAFAIPLNQAGYLISFELLNVVKYPLSSPETNNDLRDSKEEGLDPELLELSFVFQHVPVVFDACRRLQLDPVDRKVFVFRLDVPY